MTDPALVAKKLAFIETCVRELRTRGRPTGDILTEQDLGDLLGFATAIRARMPGS